MPPDPPAARRLLLRLRDYRLYAPNISFGNPMWEKAAFRVLILRLSPFVDVQKSTPHTFLAGESRAAVPEAFIDMAFLPRPQDAALMSGAGLPLILGTQSHRGLGEFDLVLVSNSWLLEQVNLPWLLAHSGVPVWAGGRGEEWPLILLGGSNASAAHALVKPDGDCVADAIFFGEGEGAVRHIVQRCTDLRGTPKTERLREIAAEIPALWPAGSLPGQLTKGRAATTTSVSALNPILPGPEAATTRLSLTRGCPCRCSFCFEGHDRFPFRVAPAEQLLSDARRLKAATGAFTLELESFNFNTHPDLTALVRELHRLFFRVNLMSQRADILARTPGLLDLEVAADKHGFTIGVEGISARLRAFLQKGLADGDLRRVVLALHERKTRELKLFYIITGRETDADLDELGGFLKWLKQVRLRAASAPRVVLSFGFLVRMPFTPLRHDALSLEERPWRAIAGRAKSISETNGFEFRLSAAWPEFAASQSLARGGYRAHELLERLAAAGSITDAGLTDSARRALEEWLAANRPEVEAGRPRGFGFPFGFLDDENSRDRLHRQYEKARAGVDAPSLRARAPVAREAIDTMRDILDRKRRLKAVHVAAELPPETAGMGAPWIDAFLLRAFLERHPGQVDNVLSMTEALVSPAGLLGDDLAWHGKTVAAVIAWNPVEVLALEPSTTETAAVLEVQVRLPVDMPVNPAQRLAEFLRDAHAPVTLVNAGDGVTLRVPEKSRGKRMVLSGSARQTGEGWVLELSIGTRPFLAEWLRSLGGPEVLRGTVVEIRSLRV
jgi:radical SAM superfamily enzyme YgiQ (UPF0313 family)